jgi:predicted enzyme related to lactoylglutathione lyase
MAGIGRADVVAFDCPDPRALARFYSALTGWEIRADDDPDDEWIELVSGTGLSLAFQRADDWTPPVWPGGEHPQQAHLDIDVPDLDDAERAVLELGARKAEFQPGETFRVFIDPVGHPFCIVLDPKFR